nr:hypothetical protein [uncultured Jannaschia sp.]
MLPHHGRDRITLPADRRLDMLSRIEHAVRNLQSARQLDVPGMANAVDVEVVFEPVHREARVVLVPGEQPPAAIDHFGNTCPRDAVRRHPQCRRLQHQPQVVEVVKPVVVERDDGPTRPSVSRYDANFLRVQEEIAGNGASNVEMPGQGKLV